MDEARAVRVVLPFRVSLGLVEPAVDVLNLFLIKEKAPACVRDELLELEAGRRSTVRWDESTLLRPTGASLPSPWGPLVPNPSLSGGLLGSHLGVGGEGAMRAQVQESRQKHLGWTAAWAVGNACRVQLRVPQPLHRRPCFGEGAAWCAVGGVCGPDL